MAQVPIILLRGDTGEPVAGALHLQVDSQHFEDYRAFWRPMLEEHARATGANTLWDWERKLAEVGSLLACKALAISFDGRLQGLMKLTQGCHFSRHPEERGKPITYIDYIETAPWNRKPVVAHPRLVGVGTQLLQAAVSLSAEDDCKGRIGLHSVTASASFYTRIGMTNLGPDAHRSNLEYFEMTAAQAAAFVK